MKPKSVIFVVSAVTESVVVSSPVVAKLLGLSEVFFDWDGKPDTLPRADTLIVTNKANYISSGLQVINSVQAVQLMVDSITQTAYRLLKVGKE